MTNEEFEKIYCAYFREVYLYLCRLSGNPDLAEEITGETFFRAMEAIDGFRGKCGVGTWLCRIARNCYCSFQRKNKRTDLTAEIPEMPDETPDIADRLILSEDSMKIHRLLHELEEPYKEVFSLRVFGELSFRQIASLFGKTENWACVTYHRAKEKIRKKMGDLP